MWREPCVDSSDNQERLCIPDSSAIRHSRDEQLYVSLQHSPRRTTKGQGESHRIAEADAPCDVEWKQKRVNDGRCELLIKYQRARGS